jgi:hypothetical protein
MKKVALLITCLSLGMATTAVADSPEENYLSARNGYIRKLAKADEGADKDTLEKAALSDLEKQIRKIIGPVKIKGFPGEGRINLETLQKNMAESDLLDGLSFGKNGPETLLVTTDGLLKDYLKNHPDLPTDVKAVSRSDSFYTVVFGDAAVVIFADLPVKSPDGKSYVHAFLGRETQDIGPLVPFQIYVFVHRPGRLLLVYAHAKTEFAKVPECEREWDRFEKKASEKNAAYHASKEKNEKLDDEWSKIRDDGFKAYVKCFGQKVQSAPTFAPATSQAQSIVDRLLK